MYHMGIPIVPAIIQCQERHLNHTKSLHSNSSHHGDGMVQGPGQVGLILNVSVRRFGEVSTFNRLARLLSRSSVVSLTEPLQLCFVDDSKGRSLLLSPELTHKPENTITMAIAAAAAASDSAVDMRDTLSSSSSSSSSSNIPPFLLNTSTKSGPVVDSTEATTLPMSITMELATSTGTHKQQSEKQSEKQTDRRGGRTVTARDSTSTGPGGPVLPIARASRTRRDQSLEAPTAKALVGLTSYRVTLSPLPPIHLSLLSPMTRSQNFHAITLHHIPYHTPTTITLL